MFKFVIRDDDPNYHTSPEELENAYDRLDKSIPVSLSVVPFHGCTETPAIPQEKWVGDEEYPVGDNRDLVSYLERKVENDRFSIMLHGYNHIKYPSGPEFVAGDNLHERVRTGLNYLEDIFDTNIEVFVPPNNSFSKEGLNAVKENDLNTFYYPTPFNRPKTPETAKVVIEDLWFKYNHKDGGPMKFIRDADRFWRRDNHSVFMPVKPYLYSLKGGKEVTPVSLTSHDDPEDIKRQMKIADEHNGVFCLAVHYHSFRSEAFKENFYELIRYAREELDPEFVHAREVF